MTVLLYRFDVKEKGKRKGRRVEVHAQSQAEATNYVKHYHPEAEVTFDKAIEDFYSSSRNKLG
jgi:hypothetical protein